MEFSSIELARATADTNGAMVSEWVRTAGMSIV